MDGTGARWITPFRALEKAGIHVKLVHPQHAKTEYCKNDNRAKDLVLTKFDLLESTFRYRPVKSMSG